MDGITAVQCEQIRQFRKQGFVTKLAPHALKLLEEALELCIAAGASVADVLERVCRDVAKSSNNIPVEVGDVAVCLVVFCLAADVSLYGAVNSCMERVRLREWEPDGDGVLRRKHKAVEAAAEVLRLAGVTDAKQVARAAIAAFLQS
jgi:phosphoribosyl-ATP pyrophosphohydrolase